MTKPIKRFEVLLGNGDWTAWLADKDTKITLNKNIVTIVATREEGTFTGTATLALIPVYTIGY